MKLDLNVRRSRVCWYCSTQRCAVSPPRRRLAHRERKSRGVSFPGLPRFCFFATDIGERWAAPPTTTPPGCIGVLPPPSRGHDYLCVVLRGRRARSIRGTSEVQIKTRSYDRRTDNCQTKFMLLCCLIFFKCGRPIIVDFFYYYYYLTFTKYLGWRKKEEYKK